jgi:hypothetical protein
MGFWVLYMGGGKIRVVQTFGRDGALGTSLIFMIKTSQDCPCDAIVKKER